MHLIECDGTLCPDFKLLRAQQLVRVCSSLCGQHVSSMQLLSIGQHALSSQVSVVSITQRGLY